MAMPAKKFMNKVEGLNILARADYGAKKSTHVAIISGGGSGHEPAHAGFVGEGMLSAAVLGGVFASPPASAVLSGILSVAGKPGCLLIVKNYTGDRLNFAIALEKAKAAGIPCEMVIVGDDCALEEKGITGRRGIAGTIFVHKCAGAAAAQGLSLQQVAEIAKQAAASVGSMGVAFSACNLPGAPLSDRLAGNLIEIGMGIHGEPGNTTCDLLPSDKLVDIMLTSIFEIPGYLKVKEGSEVAILINNLGATTPMELQIIAKQVITNLNNRGLRPVRLLQGSYMTSLDMAGVSISIMDMSNKELLKLVDATTLAPAWGKLYDCSQPENAAIPAPDLGACAASTDGEGAKDDKIKEMIKRAAQALIEAEAELTDWDKIAGDGDCGFTMKRGGEKVIADLDGYPTGDGSALLHSIANSVSNSMGGTSGALLEIALREGASAYKDGHGWEGALRAGIDAMMYYGGGKAGYRTMLDALLPMKEAITNGKGIKAAAAAATAGAEATKSMLALAGRANYVNEEAYKGVPDPGAMAVAIFFTALAS